MRITNIRSILICLSAGLFLAACRPEVAPTKEIKPIEPLESNAASPATPAPPPPDPTSDKPVVESTPSEFKFIQVSADRPRTPIVEIPGDAGISDVLSLLTEAMRSYVSAQKRSPATLEDLVSAGLLAGIPMAPQGQRFVIDAGKNEVRLE